MGPAILAGGDSTSALAPVLVAVTQVFSRLGIPAVRRAPIQPTQTPASRAATSPAATNTHNLRDLASVQASAVARPEASSGGSASRLSPFATPPAYEEAPYSCRTSVFGSRQGARSVGSGRPALQDRSVGSGRPALQDRSIRPIQPGDEVTRLPHSSHPTGHPPPVHAPPSRICAAALLCDHCVGPGPWRYDGCRDREPGVDGHDDGASGLRADPPAASAERVEPATPARSRHPRSGRLLRTRGRRCAERVPERLVHWAVRRDGRLRLDRRRDVRLSRNHLRHERAPIQLERLQPAAPPSGTTARSSIRPISVRRSPRWRKSRWEQCLLASHQAHRGPVLGKALMDTRRVDPTGRGN